MSDLDKIKQGARNLSTNVIAKGYTLAALYIYEDEDGNPLYAKFRLEHPQNGKYIRPFSKDDNGVWTEQKEPHFPSGKPLYKLPDIKKRADDVVFVVEGEKCVDALIDIGLLATTSGGADSVSRTDWQPLQDRDVIIWGDNDDAGLKYQNNVMEALNGIAKNIQRIVVEALELPEKGDCYDWLAQFKETNGCDAASDDVLALPLITDKQNQALVVKKQAGDSETLPVDDDALIEHLASLSSMEYDRQRKDQAKVLGVQTKTLDSMVKAARKAIEQKGSPFADIEPWLEPIEPAQLLDDITDTILRFIVLDKHQAQAAALWVACCWFVDEIQCAPIALINAPERACGKTQLLTVLAKLAPRSAQASSISPSVVFRMIEAYQPTLFIDEIETTLKDNEDLRGLLNAGHTRDSAYVWRSVAKGDDFEPKAFNVWGMKAVAGINAIKLAETVTSRSIIFELRRKRSSETVERIRRAEPNLFETLARKLARFSEDYANTVNAARPDLPDALSDRDQDNWEPLLQLAMVAEGHWLETATATAIKMNSAIDVPMSSANELLADIKEVFEVKKVRKISTADLITALCEDEEKSWATYNRGKPLSPRQLSNKLKGYSIASKTVRVNTYETAKGYEIDQFNDAFSRYLSDQNDSDVFSASAPPFYPSQKVTGLNASKHAGFSVTDKKPVTAQKVTRVTNVTDRKNVTVTGFEKVTPEASINAGSSRVTFCDANTGGASEEKIDEDEEMEF